MKKSKLILGAFAMALAFTACKKDGDTVDPHDHDDHNHEEETITTLKLIFTDSVNNSTTYTYTDPDGDGGNAPTIDDIVLDPSTTYTVAAEVWNESETPFENITPEIVTEANDHLLCYTVNSGDFTVTITDTDENNLPIGLASSWVTGASGTGQINVVLKHQPGIKDGTCTLGETDVEATFPVTIN